MKKSGLPQAAAISSLNASLGIGARKLRPSPAAKRKEILQAQQDVLARVLTSIRGKIRETPAWAHGYNSAATVVEMEIRSLTNGAEIVTQPTVAAQQGSIAQKSIGDDEAFSALLYKYSAAFVDDSGDDESYARSNAVRDQLIAYINSLAPSAPVAPLAPDAVAIRNTAFDEALAATKEMIKFFADHGRHELASAADQVFARIQFTKLSTSPQNEARNG